MWDLEKMWDLEFFFLLIIFLNNFIIITILLFFFFLNLKKINIFQIYFKFLLIYF